MLSKPRPEFVEEPIGNSAIELKDLINPMSTKLQILRQRETQPLRETGQGPGTAIGFFEQGIIVGALFIVLPAVSLVGYSGWFLTQKLSLHFAGRVFGF